MCLFTLSTRDEHKVLSYSTSVEHEVRGSLKLDKKLLYADGGEREKCRCLPCVLKMCTHNVRPFGSPYTHVPCMNIYIYILCVREQPTSSESSALRAGSVLDFSSRDPEAHLSDFPF